jgi:hypothetical protein
MNATTLSLDVVRHELDSTLAALAEEVRERIPNLQYQSHHGGNESFPWWVVARFSNPADPRKVIDITIECRSLEPELRFEADFAREDGTVLHDFVSGAACPRSGSGSDPRLEEALQELKAFLREHVECLSKELS